MEKLDIKTKLSEEPLLVVNQARNNMSLKRKGIITIEDFLNEDFTSKDYSRRKRILYQSYQHILNYKYLDKPMVNDVLLDQTIYKNTIIPAKTGTTPRKDYVFYNTLDQLGLNMICNVREGFIDEKLNELAPDLFEIEPKSSELKATKDFKIIDFVKHLTNHPIYHEVAQFYVNYYEDKTKNSNRNDLSTLEGIKKEVEYLINEREQLDKKIVELKEKIKVTENNKEEETKKNGK